MPRSGGGTYTLPAGSTAVSGATIESGKFNTALDDIADGLTDSLSKSGNGAATADISMGGHTLTSLGGGLVLSANDGGALGAAAKSWSDLFLASGGVINWNNGNYTITHTAGELAFNGIVTLPNAGLHILDTNASHDLIIAAGSDITADRILSIITGDAARSLTFTADASIGGTSSGTNTGDQAVAAQSDQETATSTTLIVTPGRQQFHPSAAKCWAYVTVSAGTPTLAANYNITSITDTATGKVTITIATDFSSAAWCPQVSNGTANPATSDGATQFELVAAGSILLEFTSTTATADPLSWAFAGFGDQ